MPIYTCILLPTNELVMVVNLPPHSIYHLIVFIHHPNYQSIRPMINCYESHSKSNLSLREQQQFPNPLHHHLH